MRIFVHRPEETYGPYSLQEIQESLATGNVILSDIASYDGRKERILLSNVPGVSGSSAASRPTRPSNAGEPAGSPPSRTAGAPKRAPLGCCGWILIGAVLLFLARVIAGIFEGDDDKKGTDVSESSSNHPLSPRQFGYGLANELLSHAQSDDGVTGIVFFAQSCRTENPTVRTYSAKEYCEFQGGMIAAYQDWAIRNRMTH